MITLNPYLVFKDNCEDAFNYYKLVFGGEQLHISRYKDVPADARKYFPLSPDEKVMHATLQISPQITLMGSDSIEAYQQPSARNFYLYIDAESKTEADRIFQELSVQGTVIMPIDQTFWSDCYGIVTDQFGITWKITSHEMTKP